MVAQREVSQPPACKRSWLHSLHFDVAGCTSKHWQAAVANVCCTIAALRWGSRSFVSHQYCHWGAALPVRAHPNSPRTASTACFPASRRTVDRGRHRWPAGRHRAAGAAGQLPKERWCSATGSHVLSGHALIAVFSSNRQSGFDQTATLCSGKAALHSRCFYHTHTHKHTLACRRFRQNWQRWSTASSRISSAPLPWLRSTCTSCRAQVIAHLQYSSWGSWLRLQLQPCRVPGVTAYSMWRFNGHQSMLVWAAMCCTN